MEWSRWKVDGGSMNRLTGGRLSGKNGNHAGRRQAGSGSGMDEGNGWNIEWMEGRNQDGWNGGIEGIDLK